MLYDSTPAGTGAGWLSRWLGLGQHRRLADWPAQAGDQKAEHGEDSDSQHASRDRQGSRADVFRIAEHLNPPNKGAM